MHSLPRMRIVIWLTAVTLVCGWLRHVAPAQYAIARPVSRIAPEIYGHFAEHLGGVIYGGIWVGELRTTDYGLFTIGRRKAFW